MRLAPGTILRDKYQIVGKLDEDGGGEVFEARHVDLAGRYAIKFLCEGGIRNALLVDALRREALATSELTTPGIVRVYDLDQAPDGSPFIVMEYLHGQDLGRVIRQMGPMVLTDVVAIVEAIASPLGEAHRRGIFHGDLTPENVFLLDADTDRHARVKLLDFGVARIRARAGGIVRDAGAHGPLAPEQRQGRDWEIDERTDVFAVGAIAYTLVSGRAPFSPGRASMAGRAVVTEEPAPLAAPPAVAAAVARAMSPHRDGRFRSVIDFAHALRAAVSGASPRASGVRSTRLGATPPVPVPTLHQPTDRVRVSAVSWKKTLAAAVGCGAAILLGAVVLKKMTHASRSVAPVAAEVAHVQPAPIQPPPIPPLPAPPVAPAASARPPIAAASARQTLPASDASGGEQRHHHRSPHAGMTDEARHEMEASYQKATRAFDVGNYDEAIAAYKQTYELGGDAPMLYNIAQALRLSQRPDEAVVYYRRYLGRAPTAANAGEVRTKIAELGGEGASATLVKTSAVTAARSPFDCHWPDHAAAGKAVDVACSDVDPQTPVAKASVLYRVAGPGPFAPVELVKGERGSYRGSVPAAAVTPKGLEIYFEGRRATGEAVTQNGSAGRPNGIVVAPL